MHQISPKGLLLLLLSALPAVGGQPAPRGFIQIEEWTPDTFEQGELRRRRVEAGAGTRWGYRHDYRAFTMPEDNGRSPATNGHVHATGPVFRWQGEQYQGELAPALAVSSNVLRDQRGLDLRDIQPAVQLLRTDPALLEGEWLWGVRADSRTGTYTLLPVIAWRSDPQAVTALTLGFPDSTLIWNPHSAWALRIDLGPDGGSWRVRDREFDRTSRLQARRWRGALGIEWLPSPHLSLQASVEHAVTRRWRYTLEDGTRTEITPPNTTAAVLGIALRF